MNIEKIGGRPSRESFETAQERVAAKLMKETKRLIVEEIHALGFDVIELGGTKFQLKEMSGSLRTLPTTLIACLAVAIDLSRGQVSTRRH